MSAQGPGRDLRPLLWPESIALVGVSPNKRIIRGRILDGVRQFGFAGPLHLVSRSHDEIDGLRTVRSVDELPEGVDLAIVAIPAALVPEALEACGRRGVRAAIILSSGFAEERGADGTDRQASIRDIAARHRMIVNGPNGEGFMNARMPLTATFSPAVMDVEGGLMPEGSRCEGIAVVSQSGGVGFAFFNRGRPKELRFSYVVSTGNEAGLHTLDVVDYLVDDDGTGVVLVFLEGLREPRRFAAVAERAARARKPLVVAKVGRSRAAAQAAASHTASLAGEWRAYEGVLRHHGVTLADDVEEMTDVAGAFSYFRDRLPRGRRVGILTPSGGAGAWMADACERAGLEVPVLDDATRASIDALLPAYGSTRNPVDVTAQVIFSHGYSGPLQRMLASPAIDAVIITASLPRPTHIEHDTDELRRLAREADKPVIFCGYTNAHPRSVSLLAEIGFPCMVSMPNAARAVAAMADYRAFLERFASASSQGGAAPRDAVAPREVARGATVLCEADARSVLAPWGVPFDEAVLAADADAAVAAAARLARPVALKVQSPDLPHKTEAGALALGVSGEDEVREAYARIVESARRYRPTADLRGVLVQPMAAPGVEMIVGVQRDAAFGPMVVLGSGGVLVELLDDVALAPVPLARADAHALVDRLRARRLLEGVRGAPPADREALVDLVVALARFAAAHEDEIESIDLNPVIVHAAGDGLTVADALVALRPGAGGVADAAD